MLEMEVMHFSFKRPKETKKERKVKPKKMLRKDILGLYENERECEDCVV